MSKFSLSGVKAKLVHTTNEAFTQHSGQVAVLDIDGVAWFGKYFRTSYVNAVDMHESKLIVTTRNSTYVFEVQQGRLYERSQDDIDKREELLQKAWNTITFL